MPAMLPPEMPLDPVSAEAADAEGAADEPRDGVMVLIPCEDAEEERADEEADFDDADDAAGLLYG